MVQIAVVNGINGNEAALEAVVLDHIWRDTKLYTLGNIFGESSNAEKILDRIQETFALVTRGDTEKDIISGRYKPGFGTDEDYRDWIASLKDTLSGRLSEVRIFPQFTIQYMKGSAYLFLQGHAHSAYEKVTEDRLGYLFSFMDFLNIHVAFVATKEKPKVATRPQEGGDIVTQILTEGDEYDAYLGNEMITGTKLPPVLIYEREPVYVTRHNKYVVMVGPSHKKDDIMAEYVLLNPALKTIRLAMSEYPEEFFESKGE